MFKIQAQTAYSFDKLFIYTRKSSDSNLQVKKQIILTNSNDNSFYAQLFEKDSTIFTFYFRDNNKLNFTTKIKKSDFFKAESISTNCDGISSWTEDQFKKSLKKNLKILKMFQLQDTIMDSISLKYFRVIDYRKRKMKKENYSYRYYILNDSLDSLRPVFVTPYDYLLWKNGKFSDVGIVKEFGNYNSDKDIIYSYKLDSIIEIDKKVIVPDDCTNKINKIIIKN
jgi:hypothetical protein